MKRSRYELVRSIMIASHASWDETLAMTMLHMSD